jgi:predicted DNA-binding protein
MRMKRTEVYIPNLVHRALTHLAEQRGEPKARLIRDFIEEGIKKTKGGDFSGKTTLRNLLGMKLSGGSTDLSVNLDYYLYGGDKKSK